MQHDASLAQLASNRYLDDVVGKQLDRIVAGFKKVSALAQTAADALCFLPWQVHLFVPVRDALGSQRRATRGAGSAEGTSMHGLSSEAVAKATAPSFQCAVCWHLSVAESSVHGYLVAPTLLTTHTRYRTFSMQRH